MTSSPKIRAGTFRLATAALMLALAVPLAACDQLRLRKEPDYQPSVGQFGKDVVWVPTNAALVEKMLDIAKVTPRDYLIDLGSGDGRTVIAAARRGLTAHGIEYNAELVELSRKKAAEANVSDRAGFAKADLFESDFSRASVITMFLLQEINERLRPKLLELKPGTRVVSNTFTMGDWPPDETATIASCRSWCKALLWVVPAKVEGVWQAPGRELRLSQYYQQVNGRLGNSELSEARLRGSEIAFTVEGVRYVGTVGGDRMTVARADGSQAWTAVRK